MVKVHCGMCIYADDIFDSQMSLIRDLIRCLNKEVTHNKINVKTRWYSRECGGFKERDKELMCGIVDFYCPFDRKKCETCGLTTPKSCTKCNSINIVKCGKRKTKKASIQRFRCNDCGMRFVYDNSQDR